eukprot:CAMPEP_0197847204 /NCGR_PEP_ID=MMETSP1438-20131217/5509_1 /TAXON_ID=1461541 /ORGANISM="Pterosperma sp., Strain CCMP1384" /LENGTH=458 /DNA_ID=CAMNT_0043459065 /DNA_START=189 /DNA_END=1565 /DNA_ORIENTATION=+
MTFRSTHVCYASLALLLLAAPCTGQIVDSLKREAYKKSKALDIEEWMEDISNMRADNPMSQAEVLMKHQELYGMWGDWTGIDIPEGYAEAWNQETMLSALQNDEIDTILITSCKIKLMGSAFYINRSLKLIGVCECANDHGGGCILDADNQSRLFTVSSWMGKAEKVDFFNLVLTEGNGKHGAFHEDPFAKLDGAGGAVMINAVSTGFHNVTFTNNYALGSEGGGAVEIHNGGAGHFLHCTWKENHDAVHAVETDIKLDKDSEAYFLPYPPEAEVELEEGAIIRRDTEGGERLGFLSDIPLTNADLPALNNGLFQYRPSVEIARDVDQLPVDKLEENLNKYVAGAKFNGGDTNGDGVPPKENGSVSTVALVLIIVAVIFVLFGAVLGVVMFRRRPQAPQFSVETELGGDGEGGSSFKKMEEEFERSQRENNRPAPEPEAGADSATIEVAIEDPKPEAA